MKPKTQEVKRGILKSLQLEKEPEEPQSEDDNESLDSDQEVRDPFLQVS